MKSWRKVKLGSHYLSIFGLIYSYFAPILHFGQDLALFIYIFQYFALFTYIYPYLALFTLNWLYLPLIALIKFGQFPSKTKYILFTKRCGVDDQMHNLYIEGTILERVPCTKFLGLCIDEHLSWKQHIDHCKKKMSSGIYAMNMAKHILSINHLRTLYYSLVHPYATYGIRLWGNLHTKNIQKS